MKKVLTEEENRRLEVTMARYDACVRGLLDEGYQFAEIYAGSADMTIRLLATAFPDPVRRALFVGMLVELAMSDIKPAKNGERKQIKSLSS